MKTLLSFVAASFAGGLAGSIVPLPSVERVEHPCAAAGLSADEALALYGTPDLATDELWAWQLGEAWIWVPRESSVRE